MKKLVFFFMGLAILTGCSTKGYRIEADFSDKYNGKTVVLATYDDTTVIDSAKIEDKHVVFEGESDKACLAQLMIDGRTKAYVVVEPGTIVLADSVYVGKGTDMNDRMSGIICRMDSIEALDNMKMYVDFVGSQYNENKNNPLELFFLTEFVRFNELPVIDSLLEKASEEAKKSHRIAKYRNAAVLRAATTPGKMFSDFSAVQPNGTTAKLSDFVGKGKYVLVDFWASWCPYCIKDFLQLKEMYAEYKDKGFEIVGVAVRDKSEDTKNTVSKHELEWPIIYNAERKPYDIYGFTGIPHLMLLNADGIIVSRGESPKQISERLKNIFNEVTPKH